ncbi:F0F1 ATP synthase subunit delta [Sulfurimonas sp. C5]|uniref:F0F1 ATP synthase subunit delta n=1 Tax=Sulfurimonas sp. C5 TaxID=3036947 RepID=UPI00245727D0|nr:F0F1 ATP synthase subunit delta [Sulfurimonas sp. C5]MDH4943635.1 F0F1 ATP synthase subunit delta [Sulfurimonas sp. C5]
MEELVAKRYVKALVEGSDVASMEAMSDVFSVLSDSFKDEKFVNVVTNPNVTSEDKSNILLEAVKPANSEKLNNFVKLLVQNKRIQIIPAISAELKKDIANSTKTFEGTVYSDSDLDSKVISDLSSGLSKKFDSTISLNFVKNDFNGIKVTVEGLGIEINFSKDRIDNQIIQHIIKAI